MKVDMSAKAVTARLKLTSQLWRLCLSLGKAQPVEPKLKFSEKAASSRTEKPTTDENK